ncbi:hypothetical protein VE01_09022 [Pseudogymnoascus verrucosus]|uniref:Major facilitator superfamily (MFS) profile domain-containing protein n=1 Tax=Pseudogymnoascus verrucosus TaxID=342668 RepID=A0A1B8GB40_9PEZI|nr:uncharacterized protein VE01_09022 [Pseudogymnoascus verrucosus]OBT93053.2 hypothetical protein VE01_09022 [Pseudogymnoascus verrucosus]
MMATVEKNPEAGLTENDLAEENQTVHLKPEIQKQLVRKIDMNLMPLVLCLYLLAFLDRSNIGNAQTAGMGKSLGLSDGEYQWLLTIFYIPYITFEWLALMWKLIPPHIWAFITVFTWGLASTLQAAAFNWSGMMVCRFFLAIAEAGYAPGIPYLLSFYYMRNELGLRCGIYFAAAPLATCFAGALAYGITSGHAALDNWRLLFLVEGLPSIAIAFVAFYFMPDSPEKARFLNEEEKEAARARAIRQVGQEGATRVGSINLKEVGLALMDIRNWLTALMYFSCNVSFSSLPVFLPTILEGMGYKSINAQGLSAPPYFLSFLVLISSTWIADKTQQRGLMIIGLSVIGGTGYIILATVTSTGVRYFAIFLAAAGIFPAIANILPWVLNNQGTDSKRGAGMALLNIIGQCGPLLGTRIYPKSEGPFYTKGMSICAAFMFFNGFLALVLRTLLQRQNKKLEEEERGVTQAAGGDEKEPTLAIENEGTFGYRYIL